MKKAPHVVIVTLMMVIAVMGCAGAAPRPQAEMYAREMPVEEVMVEREVAKMAPAPDAAVGEAYGGSDELALAAVSERMIVRTVELAMYVDDVDASFEEIQALAEGMGGYVANANSWHQGEHLRARLTIRVPARDLDNALDQIKDLATEVERESTSGEDVTEEYTDLESRLRNLEATEEELRELLTTVRQRTGKAEDILAVHRELTNIRGQIEQTKGRMQYLGQMSSLATVHIELTPDVLSQPLTVGRWEPRGTAASAVRALIEIVRFVVDAGIYLVILGVPVLGLIALALFILTLPIRIWRKRRRARKARENQAAE
jgi:hypothetical protein